jgi:D-arabinose 1-dehydrogenase-like Zn-dependent alcohol dehydrogenase
MLAAVVPSVNAKWEIKQVSTPQPGANQLLIKIHASGICYTDVHATKGALGVKFPYTIGHEPAGEVVELGEDVTTRKVGDRVGDLGCNQHAVDVNGANVVNHSFVLTT